MSALIIAACALTGMAAGLLGGLLGVGGGIVVVPALAMILRYQGFVQANAMHLAVGTSLASIIFTSSSSTLAHHRRRAVQWPVVAALAPGLVAGSIAGSAVARLLPSQTMRRVFGAFVLLAGGQLVWGKRPAAHRELPRRWVLGLVGAVVGSVSALVGVGGGTLTGPFLIWCNMPVRDAVATSAASALPIALAGATSFVIGGWNDPNLPAGSLGHVFGPALAAIAPFAVLLAPLGARLAHALPTTLLRRVFGVLLLVIGAKMLF